MLIIAECYLILYKILVLAVHQFLVYQMLFQRWTESTPIVDSWIWNPLYEFQIPPDFRGVT